MYILKIFQQKAGVAIGDLCTFTKMVLYEWESLILHTGTVIYALGF